jgi:hypothetical protein
MDMGEYLSKFEVLTKVAENKGVSMYDEGDIVDILAEAKEANNEEFSSEEWEDLTAEEQLLVGEKAKQRALAMIFFMNSNNRKYGVYKQDCHNANNKGRDEYPKTVTDAHTELENFKFDPRLYQNVSHTGSAGKFAGHQFMLNPGKGDDDEKIEDNGWRPEEPYECHNCDRMNECIARVCPHKTKENGQPTRNERQRMQREKAAETKAAASKAAEPTEDDGAVVGDSQMNAVPNGDDSEWETDGSWADELNGDDYGVTF